MTETHFKGNPVQTHGRLPEAGDPAPDFKAVAADLAELSLSDYSGQTVLLNIFPSIDTGVCQASVRRFHQDAEGRPGLTVLNVSLDLPFAAKRFCAAEGLTSTLTVSDFRYGEVGDKYGLKMLDGPLAGLLARAVVVVGRDGKVAYSQLVPEITQEPDYQAALAAVA